MAARTGGACQIMTTVNPGAPEFGQTLVNGVQAAGVGRVAMAVGGKYGANAQVVELLDPFEAPSSGPESSRSNATATRKRLTGGRYDPNEGQTHGVHVDPLNLPHPTEPDTAMGLRVWDFGGQLEYRATQRFYLTDRSLFLLVWNARARWDGKVTAWLDVVVARAPQSPILIVATHGDEPSAATLPSDLQARYPQIAGIFTVDSASGNGIDALRAAVQEQAASLPLMGAAWPSTWAAAGDAVRALPGYAATARHAWQCMAAAGVPDPLGQQVIARSLHDLGDVVFFADDPELSQKMILRPAWLDARISAVLDSRVVADRRGVLSRVERDRIWGDWTTQTSATG
jgi:internalin A